MSPSMTLIKAPDRTHTEFAGLGDMFWEYGDP
jgi:hypothetical protein